MDKSKLTDEENRALDVLALDKSKWIRRTVARIGRDEDLDVLVYDPDVKVRMAVVKHHRDKDLDVLVHDTSVKIRCAVADFGRPKDLVILAQDPSYKVRSRILYAGRFLDVLANDPDVVIRRKVALRIEEDIRNNPELNTVTVNVVDLPESLKKELVEDGKFPASILDSNDESNKEINIAMPIERKEYIDKMAKAIEGPKKAPDSVEKSKDVKPSEAEKEETETLVLPVPGNPSEMKAVTVAKNETAKPEDALKPEKHADSVKQGKPSVKKTTAKKTAPVKVEESPAKSASAELANALCKKAPDKQIKRRSSKRRSKWPWMNE